MNFEGFLRSLQGEFGVLMSILFVVAIVYGFARYLTKQNADERCNDLRDALKVINIFASTIVAIVLLFFVGRAVSVGYTNRMPRSDVDKTQVYEQMDGHKSDGEKRPSN